MRVVSGLFTCLLGIYLSIMTISAQVKLPRHPMGFNYAPTSPVPLSSDIVTVKVFLDLLCPDSLQAFRTLLDIMPKYSHQGVTLTVVLFPLPFFQNSYALAKAAYTIDSLNSSLTFSWISTVYENIRKFSSYNTMNYTAEDIISEIVKLATQLGVDGDTFMAMYNTWKIELKTRTSFKYGCLRGVASTPTFFVNDIPVLTGNNFPVGNISSIIAGLDPQNNQLND